IAMWIALAAITFPWKSAAIYSSPWPWIPAAALFATGLWLYRKSSYQFSLKQLGGLPEVLASNQEQHLATSGIRSRVRHPAYLAHFCEMLAWCGGSGFVVNYVFFFLAVATGILMIHWEDAELEQRLGKQSREYRRTAPAIVPELHPNTHADPV